MLTSDFLDVINEIERTYPVAEWRVGSLRIWPLVRIRLSHTFFDAIHALAAPGPRSAASRASAMLAGWMRYGSARLRDHRGDAAIPEQRPTAVFLSDGVSYTRIDGRAYEKYCDPLIGRLAASGITSLLLSPLANCPVPRHSPSVLIQPRLDRMATAAWLTAKVRRNALPSQLAGFDEAMRDVHARLSLPPFDLAQIEPRVHYVQAVARYFERILERTGASSAFVVAYYNLVGYAFNLACRRSGVASVDLQHGTPGELHPAYCRWNSVPSDGYEILPAKFWCWSEPDRTAIESSGPAFLRNHRPLLAGNVMQDDWIVGRSRAVDECDAQLRRLISSGSRPTVLLTLQPGVLSPQLRQLLLAVVRRTRGELAWWVRLHPMMLDQQGEIERWLGPEGALVEEPTRLPLYGVLRHVDVHITYSSSTVVEAEAFGIRSVLLSRYGQEFFPLQLRSGTALAAEEEDAVVDALRRQLGIRESSDELRRRAGLRLARADKALQELVRGYPQAGQARGAHA